MALWHDADLAGARAYVAVLLPLLRLGHWSIDVIDGEGVEAPERRFASFHRWPRRYAGSIALMRAHFKQSPERQRYIIVHELLHAHLHDLTDAAKDGYEYFDDTARNWAWERFSTAAELTVDALAQTIAPFVPLPGEEER